MRPITEKRGSSLVEATLALPIFLLILIFTIDLTLAILCAHKLNYQISRQARYASLSAGKKCSEVVRNIKGRLALSLSSEILSRRVKKISLSLKDENDRELPQEKKLRSNQVIKISAEVRYSLYLTPWMLFPKRMRLGNIGMNVSERDLVITATRRTIVE